MQTKEPISLEGYDHIVGEFKYLLETEKPKVAHEKLTAAALGDRSENADYQAAKEKLRHIDKRLFYLNNMIRKAHIIDPSSFEHLRVSFGSSVKIEEIDTGKEEIFTLCGVVEAEPENGLISIHSPLAKSMIGKAIGAEFILRLPNGKKEYEIIEIFYKNIFSLKKNIRTKKDFAFH
ncbi:MAG: transcription elongation factor GreA [Sulfurimonadaceae bacterium]|jgi:transcription elongation factor GreA|nr:transcription elongation factor GreA [Sulfurimonadaceae bacterium]